MRVVVAYLGRRGPGGPISLELAQHLRAKADVTAVVSTHADHYPLWQRTGIPLISAATFTSDIAAGLSLLSQASVRRVAEAIRAASPDAVIHPMVHPWTPFIQRRLPRIPHIVTVHDAAPHPGLRHRVSGLWERLSARRAARCVVLSPRFVPTLAARGVPVGRIDVIPHGIFSFYDTKPEKASERNGSPRSILFFGRITAYKGLEVLLQAFDAVERQVADVRLDIVGAGDLGPYTSLLSKLQNVRVINSWVRDDEVAPLFRRAAMTVLPYTSASQSGVIPLAAAFATPVVATTVGALPDQIRNGDTGILVPPHSVPELAAAIVSLLEKPEWAATLGDSLARETAQSGNWDRIADAYLESCRKAIAGVGHA